MQYLMIFSILVLTNGGKYALIALRTCGRDTPGNNSGSHFWEVRIFCTLRLYIPPDFIPSDLSATAPIGAGLR